MGGDGRVGRRDSVVGGVEGDGEEGGRNAGGVARGAGVCRRDADDAGREGSRRREGMVVRGGIRGTGGGDDGIGKGRAALAIEEEPFDRGLDILEDCVRAAFADTFSVAAE